MRSTGPEEFIDKALSLIKSFQVDYQESIVRQERIWKNGKVGRVPLLLPSMFGLKIKVVEDSLPWVASHLEKRELSRMEIDDLIPIREKGLIPKAIEYIEYFKSIVGKSCRIYLSDTQGPFDIAHLIRGSDIFTDMYDDTPFFHHLMELSTFVYFVGRWSEVVDLRY